jgi:sulfite oxidase
LQSNFFLTPKKISIQIDIDNYRLEIEVDAKEEGKRIFRMSLNLDEIQKRYHEHSIYATLQCGGNRRNEFGEVREVKGGRWDTGAIRYVKKKKLKA